MNHANRFCLRGACLFGALGVLLGAFAAHGLKHRLDEHALQIFETGVRYQLYHALALLAASLLSGHARLFKAGIAFTLGIALFSGSLYAIALTGIKNLGLITPIGGVCFVIGWVLLGFPGAPDKSARE